MKGVHKSAQPDGIMPNIGDMKREKVQRS